MSEDHRQVPVAEGEEGERLDKWLSTCIDSLSRNRVQSLIEAGHVRLIGHDVTLTSDRKTRIGDIYEIDIPEPVSAVPKPQDIPLNVLFEDKDLIVIDKPVGLVVHPAAGHPDGTLVNALLHHCAGELSGIGGVSRPGIVHRLDKDTSGIMVCAKSDIAHRGLVDQFQIHSIGRSYYAIVWGTPAPPDGRLETQIGRHRTDRKRMSVLSSGGKHAVTDYRVLESIGSRASLVNCTLMTGRTHQIRVHMTHLGHPLVGDQTYRGGNSTKKFQDPMIRKILAAYHYQALQAYLLEFTHPVTGHQMRFEVDLSNVLRDLRDILSHF